MPHGTVKFFNVAKGFGFITPDEGGKEVFVAAAALGAAGVSSLKTGQRVSFETQPDNKGPKAVGITLLAIPQPPRAAEKTFTPAPIGEGKKRMTFYHDPDDATSCKALGRLRAAGCEPEVIEYLTAPPAKEELRNLALLLRGTDHSLVRKYEPLFRELCLDDRFISENEFWGAIFEHPSLINGPVAATEAKARICRSDKDVEIFLAANSPNQIPPAPKRKSLPEGILRMMTGGGGAPPAEKKKTAEPTERKPDEDAVKTTGSVNEAVLTLPRDLKKNEKPEKTPKPIPKPKPAPKAAAKPKSKPKAKPPAAAKSKQQAARKPAGKARRAKK